MTKEELEAWDQKGFDDAVARVKLAGYAVVKLKLADGLVADNIYQIVKEL